MKHNFVEILTTMALALLFSIPLAAQTIATAVSAEVSVRT